jgi:hypothetical protein
MKKLPAWPFFLLIGLVFAWIAVRFAILAKALPALLMAGPALLNFYAVVRMLQICKCPADH